MSTSEKSLNHFRIFQFSKTHQCYHVCVHFSLNKHNTKNTDSSESSKRMENWFSIKSSTRSELIFLCISLVDQQQKTIFSHSMHPTVTKQSHCILNFINIEKENQLKRSQKHHQWMEKKSQTIDLFKGELRSNLFFVQRSGQVMDYNQRKLLTMGLLCL